MPEGEGDQLAGGEFPVTGVNLVRLTLHPGEQRGREDAEVRRERSPLIRVSPGELD